MGVIASVIPFFLIGNSLIPAQEFGPLGGIIAVIIFGIPACGIAGCMLGMALRAVRSDSPNATFSSLFLVGSAVGVVLATIVGMYGFYKSNASLVYVLAMAGLFVGCIPATCHPGPKACGDSWSRLKASVTAATKINLIVFAIGLGMFVLVLMPRLLR